MDIKDYIEKDFRNNLITTYNLNAVINHIGDVNFGHYYSFIKLYNKNAWYEFNDTEINYIGEKNLDVKNAYVLVYIQS